ncbi:hypothetical protein ACFL21_01680 [Patescibacteria group bacterium]
MGLDLSDKADNLQDSLKKPETTKSKDELDAYYDEAFDSIETYTSEQLSELEEETAEDLTEEVEYEGDYEDAEDLGDALRFNLFIDSDVSKRWVKQYDKSLVKLKKLDSVPDDYSTNLRNIVAEQLEETVSISSFNVKEEDVQRVLDNFTNVVDQADAFDSGMDNLQGLVSFSESEVMMHLKLFVDNADSISVFDSLKNFSDTFNRSSSYLVGVVSMGESVNGGSLNGILQDSFLLLCKGDEAGSNTRLEELKTEMEFHSKLDESMRLDANSMVMVDQLLGSFTQKEILAQLETIDINMKNLSAVDAFDYFTQYLIVKINGIEQAEGFLESQGLLLDKTGEKRIKMLEAYSEIQESIEENQKKLAKRREKGLKFYKDLAETDWTYKNYEEAWVEKDEWVLKYEYEIAKSNLNLLSLNKNMLLNDVCFDRANEFLYKEENFSKEPEEVQKVLWKFINCVSTPGKGTVSKSGDFVNSLCEENGLETSAQMSSIYAMESKISLEQIDVSSKAKLKGDSKLANGFCIFKSGKESYSPSVEIVLNDEVTKVRDIWDGLKNRMDEEFLYFNELLTENNATSLKDLPMTDEEKMYVLERLQGYIMLINQSKEMSGRYQGSLNYYDQLVGKNDSKLIFNEESEVFEVKEKDYALGEYDWTSDDLVDNLKDDVGVYEKDLANVAIFISGISPESMKEQDILNKVNEYNGEVAPMESLYAVRDTAFQKDIYSLIYSVKGWGTEDENYSKLVEDFNNDLVFLDDYRETHENFLKMMDFIATMGGYYDVFKEFGLDREEIENKIEKAKKRREEIADGLGDNITVSKRFQEEPMYGNPYQERLIDQQFKETDEWVEAFGNGYGNHLKPIQQLQSNFEAHTNITKESGQRQADITMGSTYDLFEDGFEAFDGLIDYLEDTVRPRLKIERSNLSKMMDDDSMFEDNPDLQKLWKYKLQQKIDYLDFFLNDDESPFGKAHISDLERAEGKFRDSHEKYDSEMTNQILTNIIITAIATGAAVLTGGAATWALTSAGFMGAGAGVAANVVSTVVVTGVTAGASTMGNIGGMLVTDHLGYSNFAERGEIDKALEWDNLKDAYLQNFLISLGAVVGAQTIGGIARMSGSARLLGILGKAGKIKGLGNVSKLIGKAGSGGVKALNYLGRTGVRGMELLKPFVGPGGTGFDSLATAGAKSILVKAATKTVVGKVAGSICSEFVEEMVEQNLDKAVTYFSTEMGFSEETSKFFGGMAGFTAAVVNSADGVNVSSDFSKVGFDARSLGVNLNPEGDFTFKAKTPQEFAAKVEKEIGADTKITIQSNGDVSVDVIGSNLTQSANITFKASSRASVEHQLRTELVDTPGLDLNDEGDIIITSETGMAALEISHGFILVENTEDAAVYQKSGELFKFEKDFGFQAEIDPVAMFNDGQMDSEQAGIFQAIENTETFEKHSKREEMATVLNNFVKLSDVDFKEMSDQEIYTEIVGEAALSGKQKQLVEDKISEYRMHLGAAEWVGSLDTDEQQEYANCVFRTVLETDDATVKLSGDVEVLVGEGNLESHIVIVVDDGDMVKMFGGEEGDLEGVNLDYNQGNVTVIGRSYYEMSDRALVQDFMGHEESHYLAKFLQVRDEFHTYSQAADVSFDETAKVIEESKGKESQRVGEVIDAFDAHMDNVIGQQLNLTKDEMVAHLMEGELNFREFGEYVLNQDEGVMASAAKKIRALFPAEGKMTKGEQRQLKMLQLMFQAKYAEYQNTLNEAYNAVLTLQENKYANYESMLMLTPIQEWGEMTSYLGLTKSSKNLEFAEESVSTFNSMLAEETVATGMTTRKGDSIESVDMISVDDDFTLSSETEEGMEAEHEFLLGLEGKVSKDGIVQEVTSDIDSSVPLSFMDNVEDLEEILSPLLQTVEGVSYKIPETVDVGGYYDMYNGELFISAENINKAIEDGRLEIRYTPDDEFSSFQLKVLKPLESNVQKKVVEIPQESEVSSKPETPTIQKKDDVETISEESPEIQETVKETRGKLGNFFRKLFRIK